MITTIIISTRQQAMLINSTIQYYYWSEVAETNSTIEVRILAASRLPGENR